MIIAPVVDANSNYNGSTETWNINRIGTAVGNLQADINRLEDVITEVRVSLTTVGKAIDKNFELLQKVQSDVDGLEEKHASLHTSFETHLARVTAGGAAAGGGIASAVILIVQYLLTSLGN